MKQTLGRLFLLLLFLSITLFAEVVVSLKPQAIYRGDATTLVITVNGENIEFPTIDEINGTPIEGTSSSQSIQFINGNMTKRVSKSYSFRPTHSMTIPSFEVKVDGKSVKSKELRVEVLKPTASKNGEPFVVELRVDKSSVYVGEAIDLAVKFKYKIDAHAQKVQLGEPKLEHFWIKKVDKVEQGREGDYIVETSHYQLFPQKSGAYNIEPLEALIGQRSRTQRGGVFNDPFFNDSFFGQPLRWKKIYSNALKLTVNALPNGVELYGDFKISTTVDKQKVHANRPVNLTVVVEGSGNIDDVKKFELDLDSAIVYADEPKVTSHQTQNRFTQKIAIIADQNLTIPSLTLTFFDKKSQQIKTVKSQPIQIEVTGGGEGLSQTVKIEVSPSSKLKRTPIEVKKELSEKPRVVIEKEAVWLKYLLLFLGFILGSGFTYLLLTFKNKESKKELDIVKAIRKAKDDRALFSLLLPYSKESEVVSKALNALEENIYKKAENKIDRELLMEFFEEPIG